ncbi:hypothetical protein JANAI62_12370 [Jannaschia pagri]|uniref:Transposase IS200-like domain-containing protein n=1 Tax=Jannaschia pagri TaxID=2829797 RepID=A0ABQ4NJL0_9RHOB|nr:MULTISPECIES: transposase [unclassified Jannaschia]GIT90782.1 hypothetical protein JANAI61_12400 [Jannaschia sp. AI_61]GIT94614.1 hypothetical protein JANAI62_12370 [Jannaschia sp. AI_62]
MPDYCRPTIPASTIFITAHLLDRASDLLVRHVDILREAVRSVRADRPFEIEAWVTLPDHFHAVWRLPGRDADCSAHMASIKARFQEGLLRAGMHPSLTPTPPPGDVALWQDDFREYRVRDELDLGRLISYCNLNPVKHGLVADPFDWPHSSIHRDMRVSLRAGLAAANRLDPARRRILGPAEALSRDHPLTDPIRPGRDRRPQTHMPTSARANAPVGPA